MTSYIHILFLLLSRFSEKVCIHDKKITTFLPREARKSGVERIRIASLSVVHIGPAVLMGVECGRQVSAGGGVRHSSIATDAEQGSAVC